MSRLAVLVALGGIVLAVAFAAPAGGYVANVTVGSTQTTPPLPGGFLGLSLEFSTIPRWAGSGGQPNPILVRLIRNLSPDGHPVLRIGGASTERTWWPYAGANRPAGITFDLDANWLTAVRALARAADARLLIGLNLEADQPALDRVEANEFLSGIGRRYVGGFEIGNEPDLYSRVPWYRRRGSLRLPWYSHFGTPVYARPASFGPVAFDDEFARTLKVIPPLPVGGPQTGSYAWINDFTRRFLTSRSRVRILTSHAYAGSSCVTDPSSPEYPSVPNLLSIGRSRDLLTGVLPYIALAHRVGAKFLIDEMGTISCNGRAGVSDTMASALWLLDALFAMVQQHVDGVNLHTFPHLINALFDFKRAGHQVEGIVHPLYYGAWMFSRAAPAGSRQLFLTNTARPQLRVWATRGRDGLVRVLLINDSIALPAAVRVHAPAHYGWGQGAVVRLLAPGSAGARVPYGYAPSAYETGGLTIGGRGFGTHTLTGMLRPPVPDTVLPRAGTYRLSLSPASALLLTLRPRS